MDKETLVILLAGATLVLVGLLVALLIVLAGKNSLIEELRESADKDLLTGVLNRRGLSYRLTEKVCLLNSGGKRQQGALSSIGFILFDIDYFKKVNDQYGHAVGDNVLVTIAKLISFVVRSDDMVCRYGGEEFLVAFPGVSECELFALAERIRSEVEGYNWSSLWEGSTEKKLNVTLSGGIFLATSRGDLTSFFIKVDKALYEAKGAGRNRVMWATDE